MKIQIDKEGKIAIPRVIRDNLDLHPGDSFFIEPTDEGILLTPLQEDKKVNSESVIVFSGLEEGTTRYFTLK
ncbi:MAG: AbrB/MazE/SpoVT family DNA-binding domain-containing protein [Spirochaetales bacterium]|nr:AbrB/MazE/SpoVT family DNA-binding domain-containing protein [Spirochaetales bacterium]